MSGRLRVVDLVLVGVLVVLLVGVGGLMLAGVGASNEQARCTANLRLFGKALALYETTWGVLPLSDPFPAAPECSNPPSGGDCRYLASGEKIWDPPHGRLLHQMGYIPDIPAYLSADVTAWDQWAWGFYYACLFLGEDGVPAPAICPSAILENVMSETSTEINFGGSPSGQYWAQTRYKYAACYTPNRLLRSPGGRSGHGRFPRLPGAAAEYDAHNNNQFSTAGVRLTLPAVGEDSYYVQAINSGEVTDPGGTLYLCDSLDCRIGNGDELVDPRYGNPDISAGSWFALHRAAVGTSLGARHNGKANVLYVDGHVSDDNQTPRTRRGDLITASTFTDFIEDYGIGTQHHVMPGGRRVDIDT